MFQKIFWLREWSFLQCWDWQLYRINIGVGTKIRILEQMKKWKNNPDVAQHLTTAGCSNILRAVTHIDLKTEVDADLISLCTWLSYGHTIERIFTCRAAYSIYHKSCIVSGKRENFQIQQYNYYNLELHNQWERDSADGCDRIIYLL